MRKVRGGLHLKNHTLRSNVGFIKGSSMQILALHFKPIWVHSIRRGHENISMCRIECHGCSTIWLTPLKSCSIHGSRIGLLGNPNGLIWRRRSFIFWWRCSSVGEIDCCYVMDAGSSLIFPSWKLPDKVLLSMTSHLSWRSGDNEIARDISPVPFAIFFKAQ